MSFVLDNPVALAWRFENEQNPAIVALLDRVADEGAVAPRLWPVEALNGLWTAERRGHITAATRQRQAAFPHDLPIAPDDEMAGRIWVDAARLAACYRLTARDAVSFKLAIRLRLPLATGDRSLAAAPSEAGSGLLPII